MLKVWPTHPAFHLLYSTWIPISCLNKPFINQDFLVKTYLSTKIFIWNPSKYQIYSGTTWYSKAISQNFTILGKTHPCMYIEAFQNPSIYIEHNHENMWPRWGYSGIFTVGYDDSCHFITHPLKNPPIKEHFSSKIPPIKEAFLKIDL